MSKETSFAPISFINAARLKTDVQIPVDMDSAVGINVARSIALCQIAGVHRLSIVTQHQPEQPRRAISFSWPSFPSRIIPGRKKYPPRYRNNYQDVPVPEDKEMPGKHSRWSDLIVSLNPEEIQRKIEAKNHDIKQACHWARQINSSLKQAIVNAGVHQLLDNLEFREVIISAFGYSGLISSIVNEFGLEFLAYPIVYFNLATLDLIGAGFENFKLGKGRRWSVFLGSELDRLVALLALSTVSTLVKPLKQTSG